MIKSGSNTMILYLWGESIESIDIDQQKTMISQQECAWTSSCEPCLMDLLWIQNGYMKQLIVDVNIHSLTHIIAFYQLQIAKHEIKCSIIIQYI